MTRFGVCKPVFWLLILWSSIAFSQQVILNDGEEQAKPASLVLPYAFNTETLGLTYGIAGGTSGYGQEQMAWFGAYLESDNDSKAGFLSGKDIQLPFGRRSFLDVGMSHGRYTELRGYVQNNPQFPNEVGGTNESAEDNFVQTNGNDTWAELTFYYVLPLGRVKESAIHTYRVKRGIVSSNETGGDEWNPKSSGKTTIGLQPFYRSRDFVSATRTAPFSTNGLKLALEYDNTDFWTNPSKGSKQRIGISRDFGEFDSSGSWTFLELELDKYFSLGKSKYARQRVIALNLWTGNTPSWSEFTTANGLQFANRPPYYEGANLGGIYRMRGYPSYRFNDKAVIYYSAEYRYIPKWNPFKERKFLWLFDLDWLQLVGFAELGRVAPSWNIETLHEDMKWDVGASLRSMISNAVIRIDVAYSEESTSVWAMVGHPF